MGKAPFSGKFLNTVEFSGTHSNSLFHMWVASVSQLVIDWEMLKAR